MAFSCRRLGWSLAAFLASTSPATVVTAVTTIYTCGDLKVELAKADGSEVLDFIVDTTLACTSNMTIPAGVEVVIKGSASAMPLITVQSESTFDSLFINKGTLTLENLKFQGSLDQLHRVVQSTGTLVVRGCAFREFLQRNGGVIYTWGGSVLLDGSHFSMNVASYKGGVVYADSTALTVNNCEFSGNSAAYSAGDIYAANEVTLVIAESTFTKSFSSLDAASVYACGGTVSHCTFDYNEAPQSGAIVSSGDNCPALAIASSTFTGNRASAEGGTGGAVRALQTDLSISETTFESNFASEAGAAIYFLTSLGNKLEVDQCTFSDNENGGLGEGSAVWIENSAVNAANAPMVLGHVLGSKCDGGSADCDISDTFGNLQVDETLGCNICVPGNDTAQAAAAQQTSSGDRGLVIGLSVTLAVALAVAALAMFAYRRSRRRRIHYDVDGADWGDEY